MEIWLKTLKYFKLSVGKLIDNFCSLIATEYYFPVNMMKQKCDERRKFLLRSSKRRHERSPKDALQSTTSLNKYLAKSTNTMAFIMIMVKSKNNEVATAVGILGPLAV